MTGDGTAAGDERNRRLWTVAIFLSVATTGAMLQARGAVLPSLAGDFGPPEWQLGLVAPAGTVGYLVVMVVVGSGAGHLDSRRFILVGLVGSALALLAMGLAPAFALFLGAIVIRGAATGAVRALDRPLLSHFYPGERGRVYNRYDMAWAVGAASGPLAVAGAVAVGSWRLVYGALAVTVALVAALFWRLDPPALRTTERPLTRDGLAPLLGRPEVLGMLVVLFFTTGVEGALFTWLPYYASAQLPDGLSEATLTLLLVTYVPGRYVSGWLAERVDYLTLAGALVAGLVPAVAYTFVLADGLWVLVGVAATGLLLSGAFPTLLAYATEAVPEHSGPVNAIATGVGSVGIGSVPAVLGVVVDRWDVASAMSLLVVPLVAGLAVLAVAGLAQRRRDRQHAGVTPSHEYERDD